MKIKTGFLFVLTSGLLLTSCTSFLGQGQQFIVNSDWVQNTLSQENKAFRKINRMTPILHKNKIVVGNALDGLVAYDIKTRQRIWKLDVEHGIEASGMAIRDTLFVGSNAGLLYSINMVDGKVNWTFDAKTELLAEPLLDEGVLYFVSAAQSVYSLDASTGRQLWLHSRQDTAGGMTIRGGSKPSLSNGILYVGFNDGSLVALNAKTGSEQWEILLNRNSRFKDIDASPVVDQESIYINSYDDKIYCISKDKGEILWSSPYGGASTPLIDQDRVFTSSSRGELVALNRKDGTLLWKLNTTRGVFVESVLFSESLISVGESQGRLLFLNKIDGSIMGAFEPGRGVFSRPVVSGDRVYFISGEANLYSVQAGFQTKSSVSYLK